MKMVTFHEKQNKACIQPISDQYSHFIPPENTRKPKVLTSFWIIFPAGIYLFKVNDRNRTRCEICLKLIIKTPEQRQWRLSGVFIVNFEHIFHPLL